MAMIKCPECGKAASSTAAACPHCGAPISQIAEQLRKKEIVREQIRKPKRHGRLLVIGGAGILFWVFIINALRASSNIREPEALHSRIRVADGFELVWMPDSLAIDRAAVWRAAQEICGERTHCMMQVWSDSAMIPAQVVDMPDASLEARRAVYRRNRVTGLEEVHVESGSAK